MRNRSLFSICLPFGVFITACALSRFTLIVAVLWMTIGVISLGHRPLESFPSAGISRKWLRGYRSALVWFYHLAWWPWYMRASMQGVAHRFAKPTERMKPAEARSESASERQRGNDEE
jgi:hypothetical protein